MMLFWTKRLGLALSVAAGLMIASPAIADDGDSNAKITFTKDIVPILQENCQVCHRPGGANLGGMVAPMALTTYREVRPWAKAIATQVAARDMPPWDATAQFHGVFRNERTLTDEQIDKIVRWVETGAPRGNRADAPPPIDFPDTGGWQIGEPDLVVSMPEPFFVGDEVEDRYITFKTPLTEEMMPEDRYVKAVEFRPGSPAVHHIISMPLGGIAPGNEPTVFDEGFGQLLTKGATITWEMHYHKEKGEGTGIWDQSSVALKFYPKGFKPKHVIQLAPLENMNFRIPAGAANHTDTANHTFKRDTMVISYMPHMHLRGKAAKYVAYYPDGTNELVLDVPGYDFNWQTAYNYRDPKILPAGTRLELTCTWDNSADNPSNPDPTRAVTFGLPTTAEMMFGFVAWSYVEELPQVVLDPEALAAYAGKYQIAGAMTVTILAEGERLSIEMAGQGKFPLTAEGNDKFSLAMAGLEMTFQRDAQGNVNSAHVSFQGQEHTAQRIE